MRFTPRANYALMSAALLMSCGSKPSQTAKKEIPAEPVRTCESIRGGIVLLSEKNPVQIIKIYEPKTVKTEPKKLSCTGRALLSNTTEAKVYYQAFQDPDGDWMLQYSGDPLG